MRKIILPLVICLALVASIGAATYTAKVGTDGLSNISNTQDAELAFSRADGAIAVDLLDIVGTPNVISVNFRNIQRNSRYEYGDVLIVTNNKPYTVRLTVDDVTGKLGTPFGGFHSGFNFTIIGGGPDWPSNNQQCLWDDGRSFNYKDIPAGKTVWIDFILTCGDVWNGGDIYNPPYPDDYLTGMGDVAADQQTRNGTIIFKAIAPTP